MKNLFTLLFAMLVFTQAEAQLVAWNLRGAAGNEATSNSNVNHGNMEISTLSRGDDVSVVPAGHVFAGEWPENISEETEDLYYEFTVKAKEGYIASLSSIDVRLRVQANGPRTYIWKYSLDGGASFMDIGTPYTLTTENFNFSDNAGIQQPTVNLSDITALQNLSSSQPVVFRIYAWNTDQNPTPGARGFRIGQSASAAATGNALEIGGSVVNAVPSVLAWNMNGTGNGLTGTSNVVHENMETSTLSLSDGVTEASASSAFAAEWPAGISEQTDAENTYFEFTVAPKPGYTVSLHALDAKLRIQTNGPKTYIWKYKLDGEADFVEIGMPNTWSESLLSQNNNEGFHQPGVDLSGIAALQNISASQPVIFRIYAWNVGTGTGARGFRIGRQDALIISGTVEAESTTPVKLTSFKGSTEGSTVKLSWITTSEQNNSYFEILRSSGGSNGTVIGTIQGNGTSNETHHYNFTDYSPLQGINYYQLRQVDQNGKSELSEVIAVNANLDSPELKVTATESGIAVYVNGAAAGKARLRVSDIAGRLLADKDVKLDGNNNVLAIPITLANGIYVVSLTTAGRQQLNTRFYK